MPLSGSISYPSVLRSSSNHHSSQETPRPTGTCHQYVSRSERWLMRESDRIVVRHTSPRRQTSTLVRIKLRVSLLYQYGILRSKIPEKPAVRFRIPAIPNFISRPKLLILHLTLFRKKQRHPPPQFMFRPRGYSRSLQSSACLAPRPLCMSVRMTFSQEPWIV